MEAHNFSLYGAIICYAPWTLRNKTLYSDINVDLFALLDDVESTYKEHQKQKEMVASLGQRSVHTNSNQVES